MTKEDYNTTYEREEMLGIKETPLSSKRKQFLRDICNDTLDTSEQNYIKTIFEVIEEQDKEAVSRLKRELHGCYDELIDKIMGEFE